MSFILEVLPISYSLNKYIVTIVRNRKVMTKRFTPLSCSFQWLLSLLKYNQQFKPIGNYIPSTTSNHNNLPTKSNESHSCHNKQYPLYVTRRQGLTTAKTMVYCKLNLVENSQRVVGWMMTLMSVRGTRCVSVLNWCRILTNEIEIRTREDERQWRRWHYIRLKNFNKIHILSLCFMTWKI